MTKSIPLIVFDNTCTKPNLAEIQLDLMNDYGLEVRYVNRTIIFNADGSISNVILFNALETNFN